MKRCAFTLVFAMLTASAQEYTTERRPVLLAKCTPRYSEEARRAGLQGTVVLAVQIHPDGLAHSIRVTKSLGMGLDESAAEAVRQWRFKPGEKHGEKVIAPITIEVNFRLNDPSRPSCAAPPAAENGKR